MTRKEAKKKREKILKQLIRDQQTVNDDDVTDFRYLDGPFEKADAESEKDK